MKSSELRGRVQRFSNMVVLMDGWMLFCNGWLEGYVMGIMT